MTMVFPVNSEVCSRCILCSGTVAVCSISGSVWQLWLVFGTLALLVTLSMIDNSEKFGSLGKVECIFCLQSGQLRSAPEQSWQQLWPQDRHTGTASAEKSRQQTGHASLSMRLLTVGVETARWSSW
jgi:type II secretory pathway component PulL